MVDPVGSGRIVVGVDGSKPSQAALEWAAAEAALRGGTVVAVHAVAVPVMTGFATGVALAEPAYLQPGGPLEAAADRLLNEAVERLAPHPAVKVLTRVEEGPAASVLLEMAADADLLVLGCRGRGGFRGLLLGSTTQACIHHSPCPTALLRVPAGEAAGEGIVVGVDGSPGSVAALSWAVDEARRRGTRLTAVMVWDDPYTLVGPPPPPWVAGSDLSRMEELLDRTLARAVPEDATHGVEIRQEIRSGHPAQTLVEAASGASLLVVGWGGKSSLGSSLLGSVSLRCAQLSQVPLVVVTDHAQLGPGMARAHG